MQPVYSARRANHPTYGHTVYWGEVHIDGKLRHGIGPYRTQAEAIAGAKERGQREIPGTEPISQGQIAQRRAAAPLRPAKPQAPCDVGLFSDDAAQTDLIEMLMEPAND